jgi:hypothetical protein
LIPEFRSRKDFQEAPAEQSLVPSLIHFVEVGRAAKRNSGSRVNHDTAVAGWCPVVVEDFLCAREVREHRCGSGSRADGATRTNRSRQAKSIFNGVDVLAKFLRQRC